MGNPAISVVMAVYNCEKYLKEAIESILNQTFSDFEFIIVNDGSTDRTGEIVKFFDDSRIVLIQQDNQGLSAALNSAIRIAKGKYIARADADDISWPERLKKQFEFMEKNPQCVAVGSWAHWIDINGGYLCTMKMSSNSDELKRGLPFKIPVPHAGAIYRKNAVIEIGGYKDVGRYFYHEDMLLMIDLSRKGEFYNLPEVLSSFRVVPSSNTQRADQYFQFHREIVRRYYEHNILDTEKIRSIKESWGSVRLPQRMSIYYLKIGKIFLEKNFQRKKAIRNFIQAIMFYPLNGNAWFNLLLSFLPIGVVKRWKSIRCEA